METPYKTPGKVRSGENLSRKAAVAAGQAKAVDLVTGKAKVEYFFDPSLALNEAAAETPFKPGLATPMKRSDSSPLSPGGNVDPLIHASKHLFMPCSIIKTLDEEKDDDDGSIPPTLVKTADGALHKIVDSSKLIPLTAPDDYIGMDDVLHLAHVTEASLLHTLRLRYKRDDIYTSAGPILMSINPYKTINGTNGESLYSEKVMMLYRNRELGNVGIDRGDADLPPHLFEVADRAYSALIASAEPMDMGIHMEEEDPVLNMEGTLRPGSVRSQSIIISGESGAGKTEATKIIMQYLSRITKKSKTLTPMKSPDGKLMATLEDRVLSSNPLLESFGNARTLRNDNSSRFGKFIRISFSTGTGHIVGATISNYLLEKTRITTQVEGERNYHVFYQLLTGAGQAMLEELGLAAGVSGFRYLGNRDALKSRRDATGFAETKECLTRIGLSVEEQMPIFQVLAAVLHLGNIEFEEKGDNGSGDDHGHGHNESAKIAETSLPSLRKACELLGLEQEKVSEAILTKLLSIGGKTIHKPQSIAQASDKRDALAKLTYSSLFVWLVHRVNVTISSTSHGLDDSSEASVSSETSPIQMSGAASTTVNDGKHDGFIGVLDIYGFECFETNGYEQFLINYCNEKLQRHFNKHLFEVEQELYSSEGVDWTYITFNDNRPCLELIEGGGGNVGILNTLDDAWGGMGTASEKDVNFVSNLHASFGGVQNSVVKAKTKKKKKKGSRQSIGPGGHKNFVMPKFGSDRQFIVIHYAGEVKYTANGFVEKNMESLSNELKDLGVASTIPLAKDMFKSTSCEAMPSNAGIGRRSTIRGVSVGSQFRLSLQSLVSDLEHTQPHYIRCIKPNLNKEANSFDSGEVLRQLRYAGMMETIRIRREGYALREEHKSFYNRFSMLLNPEDFGEGAGISQLVNVLSRRLNVSDHDWQIGHSKIFLRRELADKLERLARLKVHAAARRLGRFGRLVAERRASELLTSWCRFRLFMIKKHREDRAANAVIALYRMHRQMKTYAVICWLVIKLQSFQRRKLAAERARKLRDPYGDMSFKELQNLLSEEQSRLEDAVQGKDFVGAAEIEANLEPLKEAMESKRPLTRSVLESRIDEVQKRLDDALSRKSYSECGPLQEKLESLTKMRADIPTIDELKEALRAAEEAVASAAENRDFAAAASGQVRIEEARQRLKSAMDAEGLIDDECNVDPLLENGKENNGISCRADLEKEIEVLNQQIEDAITAKDFTKASSLQPSLDEKLALRELFPTATEITQEIAKAKSVLEEAIAKKDFAKASALNDEILSLEKKLTIEMEASGTANESSGETEKASVKTADGEVRIFESRAELEHGIAATKESISKAVGSKKFKEAEKIQSTLDDMEKLRSMLPSVEELKDQINEQKKAMDTAISAKKFSQAEEIDSLIALLEKKLETEKSRSPELSEPLPEKENRPTSSDEIPQMNYKNSTKRSRKIRQSLLAAEGLAPPREKIKPSGGHLSSFSEDAESKANSLRGRGNAATIDRSTEKISFTKSANDDRPVSKLRPKRPILSTEEDSILSVTQMLASKRGDASLVVGPSGGLAGIITDTDVTRRVVAKHVDPVSTSVSEVMTKNPTCVSMSDSAMEAMSTMVENHFRHLPVVDDSGAVVGLLDIAKCLNDAISKLERADEKSGSAADDAVEQMASLQGAGGAQAAALQALLGPLLAKAFSGKSSPTVRSLLAGRPATIVTPETTVQEAGETMAESRKAALVVEDGQLVGIFGFKDMMTRVIAKELPLDDTAITAVMTPNPESVSPDITVLEALQMMHDNKFLTLPVCEENGAVIGIVDVMDVIYGCGGTEGWRSIFSSAMEVDDGTASVHSRESGTRSIRSAKTNKNASKSTKDERPVSKLRPKKPILSTEEDSILSVTQMLASKRGDASLVVGASGGLAGIITDTDVTRRVVARHVNPASTSVSEVMTKNPTCVSMSDSAMEAMSTMVENHFRHLPVVDDSGAVVGLLDIAKCLNDAISKLERADERSGSAADDAVEQMASLQGAGGAQAAALQALLGPLLAQAFSGKTSPTVRSLLAGRPATLVTPETTVQEAGETMAESRKAALVVEDGQLVGIFGFKDMMTRVVAKELPLNVTAISEVMTPHPESVSPDISVMEALQLMHDNKFLTLPVCEENGAVIGIVDVMDVIYGCGGTEGWRSIFCTSMEVDDGTASVYSHQSGARSTRSARANNNAVKGTNDERPVSKLRPKKPLLSSEDDSILSVTKMLASKRGDASLVVGASGGLAGIITDTDVTRRVVARHINPASTSVSDVMTKNPTCVSMSDPAIDAMGTMVENHFRHLPVVDDSGAVVGLLDIAKCLNDAIRKLERADEKSGNAAEDAVEQMASLQGAGGAQAAALQALLGPLLAQAFSGKTSPTVRSLLAGRRATLVTPETTVQEAGETMAESRKAALVVEDGHLVGIFGFKDMMTRVIAKELPLDETAISEVMTPNPESVLPDITVLEALQMMHDNKFLTLPVCEENGAVIGIVDVMDVIYGCGGTEGWRSIFSSAMEVDDGTASVYSHESGTRSIRSAKASKSVSNATKDERPVSKLRPKKPLLSTKDESVLSVTKMLASKRGDASIIVGASGGLVGIVTDTDVTRRVVAKQVDPASTSVSEVMTKNPTCVSMSDPALEAMGTMVENHFRHLPVLDDSGAVVGLLDIAKCLNDAICKLEQAQESSEVVAQDAVEQMASLQGAGGAQAAALQALLGPLLSQAFGGKTSPTVRSLLAGRPATIVSPQTSVREAGEIMAERRKAALVVDDGELVGIFGFKDMMTRVIAKELPVDETAILEVMTPNPESVSPDITVLEALQIMHDNKFLTLPVCEENGTVVGIVDVMDVIYGCGGAEGWRSMFSSTIDMDCDASDQQSVPSVARAPLPGAKHTVLHVSPDARFASVPSHIPTHVEIDDVHSLHGSVGVSLLHDARDFAGASRGFNDADLPSVAISEGQGTTFKIVDPNGKTHRIRSQLVLEKLLERLAKKVGGDVNASSFQLQFVDDEGDAIVITNDDDLVEAVNLAGTTGNSVVKLTATLVDAKSGVLDNQTKGLLLGAAGAVLAVGAIAMMAMKPRK